MTEAISSCSLSSYKYLDYIPLASTAFNLTCIFYKYTQEQANEHQDPDYIYLRDKDYSRCFLLLVPIIGNLFIALYDLACLPNDSRAEIETSETSRNIINPQSTHHSATLNSSEIPQSTHHSATLNSSEIPQSTHHSVTLNSSEIPQSPISTSETNDPGPLDRVRQNGMELQYLSDEQRDTEQYVWEAVGQNGLALQFASTRLKNQDATVLIATRQNPRAIAFAFRRLQNNLDFVSALAWDGEDRELGLRILRVDGTRLQEASETLRDDRDFVLNAVQNQAEAFQHASERLKNDPATLQAIMEECVEDDTMKARHIFNINGRALEFASQEILTHQLSVILAINQNPSAIHFALPAFFTNPRNVNVALSRTTERNEILRIIRLNGLVLEHASEEQKNDRDFVLEAVRNQAEAFQFASNRLKNDLTTLQTIMQEYVGDDTEQANVIFHINGLALQFASVFVHNTPFSVATAVRQNPAATHFVSPDSWAALGIVCLALQGTTDRNEILRIIQLNGLGLQFLSTEQKDDEEIVRAAIEQNVLALQFASNRLRENPEIIQLATQNNPDAEALALLPQNIV